MKKIIVTLTTALMLGLSATTMAAPGHHDHRYDRHYEQPKWSPKDRYEQPKWSNERWNRHDQRVNLKRGERLPAEYRSNRYKVANYRVHRLYEPPRGYHWMQVKGKYVLVDSKYRVYRVA